MSEQHFKRMADKISNGYYALIILRAKHDDEYFIAKDYAGVVKAYAKIFECLKYYYDKEDLESIQTDFDKACFALRRSLDHHQYEDVDVEYVPVM